MPIKRWHGIIPKDLFQRIHDAQGGRCGVCFQRKALVTDHNRRTGRIRGLLCDDCNRDEGRLAARADATGRPIATNLARWTKEDGWPDLDDEIDGPLYVKKVPSMMHAHRRKAAVVSEPGD